jgi:CheY-like chemotaxis protein
MVMNDDHREFSAEEFTRLVHDALGHVYDGAYLRAHALTHMLVGGDTPTVGDSQALRRMLFDAMRSLHPPDGVAAQSPAWRTYRILEGRYIDALSPGEVMQQLGLGKSQYFQEQARAVEALSAVLWERRPSPTHPVAPATSAQLAETEVERLFAQAQWEAVELLLVLEQLRGVFESLAHAKGVTIQWLYADRVLLRQAFLNVFTYVATLARGGTVGVSTFAEGNTMGIRIAVYARDAAQSADGEIQPAVGLDISRRFMAAMGGRVETNARQPTMIELIWSTFTPRVLLVVDDNPEFAELFRRYLAGSGWQIVGATGAAEARHQLRELRPAAISLDVMMPREDGWELLTALKADPDTRDIPVVVCSVLHEPELALALGATAFLPKTITQQALLQTLAPLSQGGATLGLTFGPERSTPA